MSDSESSSDSGDSTAGSNTPAVSSSETISYATDGAAFTPSHPSSNSGLSLSAGLGGVKEAAGTVGTALTLKGIAAATNPLVSAAVIGYGLYKMAENAGPFTGPSNSPGSSSSSSAYNNQASLFDKPKVIVPVPKEVTAPQIAVANENAGEIKTPSAAKVSADQPTVIQVQTEKMDYSFLLPVLGLLAFGGFYGS